MNKDVFVRGGENITELDYYLKIARVQPTYTPECEECGGGGYLRYQRPIGSTFFGQMKPCRTCSRSDAKTPEGEQWWQK